jgi:phosphate:Na+ symporter
LETLASLLGGLGLFLVGIKAIGVNLQLLAGPRLRQVLAAATRGPAATAAAGLALGGLTQSSNAATTIATSLAAAGLLPMRAAMPLLAFANVGTAGLVLLATVDLRLAVLWLVGLVGFLGAFGMDRAGRLKPALAALLGLGLLFLGLDLLKTGAGPLAADSGVQAALVGAAGSLPAAFLAAALLAVAVHSASTVTILALALHQAGLFGFEQAVLAVYGALLGSGLAVLLPGLATPGAARRLPVFQAGTRAAAVAILLLLFVAERSTGLPLVLAALGAAGDAAHRIGLLFLAAQLLAALLPLPVLPAIERLLARLCPDSAADTLARPRYLYDGALEDPASALELVAREQRRLLARLPALLDPLREDGAGAAPRAALLDAAAALERAVRLFLAELRGRAAAPAVLEGAVALESRAGLIGALRETIGEFGDSVAAARPEMAAAPLLARLVESLHLLLTQLAEVAEGGGAEDAAMLRALTEDRGEMMEGLRRRLATGPGLCHAGQDLVFRATAQFERAVWLVRRMTLALEATPDG